MAEKKPGLLERLFGTGARPAPKAVEPFEPILELPEIVGIVAVIFGGGFIIGKGNAHPPTLARVALRTQQAMRRCHFLAPHGPI